MVITKIDVRHKVFGVNIVVSVLVTGGPIVSDALMSVTPFKMDPRNSMLLYC